MDKRFEYLVGNSFQSDFKFILTDDDCKEVPAHRVIITSASEELKKMIFGYPFSTGNSPSNQMEVDGISSDGFIEILRYIYAETSNIDEYNVYEILTKSNYFGIVGLERLCIQFLTANLNTNNVCLMFSYFFSFIDYAHMLEKCQTRIQTDGIAAFKLDIFVDIPLKVLKKILSFDVIRCPEKDLFELTLAWATNECAKQNIPATVENKRKVLNGAEDLLRFSALTLDEFQECLKVNEEFFTPEEIEVIEKNMNTGTHVKRLFREYKDLTWNKRSDVSSFPPNAVFAFAIDDVLPVYVGRVLLNQKYIPVEIIPSLNKAYYYDNSSKQISVSEFEVLCGQCNLFNDFTLIHDSVLLTNTGNHLQYITTANDRLTSISFHDINSTHVPFLLEDTLVPKLADPKNGIPEDVVVGGHFNGVDYLICKVYHNGDIIPARVKRDESFATVSYEGAAYEKIEFVYICNSDNVKFIPCNANYVPAKAVVGGRTKNNELLYIGRVHYQNQHIPGKFQQSLGGLIFSYNGEEKKALHFEVLVHKVTTIDNPVEDSSASTETFDSDEEEE